VTRPAPVFYDCEASSFEGFPIEVGWAFADPDCGAIVSESHLVIPPLEWAIMESWDRGAQRLHGIALADLYQHGRRPAEVARRMNEALDGRGLFSDDRYDAVWLRLLFDAAGLSPLFVIATTNARELIAQAATEHGLSDDACNRARALADAKEPCRHRAEADARHLAVLWSIINGTARTP
jgi:hypothetical protein